MGKLFAYAIFLATIVGGLYVTKTFFSAFVISQNIFALIFAMSILAAVIFMIVCFVCSRKQEKDGTNKVFYE